MDCSKCDGICCSKYTIELYPSDISRISHFLNLDRSDFIEFFLDDREQIKQIIINGKPYCSFFNIAQRHAGCMIHKVKPYVCECFVCNEDIRKQIFQES